MTPTAEAEFIALWQQGLETAAIAQRLGVPRGTVQSRAHRLQQQGKLQPRPRGGAYPRSKALARQDGPPAPPTTHAPPAPRVPPAVTFVAVPEIQEILSMVKNLQTRVGLLEEQPRAPPGTRPTCGPRGTRSRTEGDSTVDCAPVEGPDRASESGGV